MEPSVRAGDLPTFIQQVETLKGEITEGQWNNREDKLAETALILFRSNYSLLSEHEVHKFENEEFTSTVINLLEALNSLENKTSKVAGAVDKIGFLLQDSSRAPGSIKDLKSLPCDTPAQIKASLEKFRQLIHANVPDAKDNLARWIHYAEIPLSKLNLTMEELIEFAPHFTYLCLNREELTEEDINDFISRCTNLQKLKLATDEIKHLPPLPANLKILNVTSCNNLEEISGLNEGLTEFISLSCESLKQIVELPKSLTYFACADCPYLETSPDLHEGLKHFDCSNTRFKALPVLPSTLQQLKMMNCGDITSLPRELPKDLLHLTASRSGITNLPDSFPKGMKSLTISYCSDLVLPEDFQSKLPQGIKLTR